MQSPLSPDSLGARPVRRRFRLWVCLLIGCLLAAVIGLAEPYLTIYLSSSYLFTDFHSGGAAFFVVVLFLLVNVGVASLWPDVRLSAEELLFIAAMMFASGSVVTSGGTTHMVPMLSAVYYYANTANEWALDLWPYLPRWLSPIDPGGGHVALTKFWEGLAQGEPIPWGPWVRPLALWGLYLMAVWTLLTSVMVFVRKQWMEYEHLSYPIAQVPAEVCLAAGNPRAPGTIFRSKAFWLGLGASFLLYSFWGISYYVFGKAGRFRISQDVLLAAGYSLRVRLDLVVVGLVFLIPNRIAFSVWTLALVSWFVRAYTKVHGVAGMTQYMPYGGPANTQHLAVGALLVFVGSSLWYGRAHLLRALKCALGIGEKGYDAAEPTSYRLALIALVLSAIVALVWLMKSGLHLPYAVLFLAVFLLVYFAMARIIAQVGLPSASAIVIPGVYVGGLLGSNHLGRTQVGALAYQFWNADLRNTPAVGTAHGMYLARRPYGLFFAMLLAILITYVAAAYTVVRVSYREGASSLAPWFMVNSARVPWWWMQNMLNEQRNFNAIGLVWSGAGAALMGLLVVAQRAFFWWPLHPVALLICNTHMVINFWFSIFFAWLVKGMVVKFTGQRGYRRGRQLLIGAVLGGFLAGGTWAIVDLITGSVGNTVFNI